jgi:hypothetical protein
MIVVSESVDGKMRHFRHYVDSACGGGEGDRHEKWKNWAAERLHAIFGDRARQRATTEGTLGAPVSDKQTRSADALVLFEDLDEQLGRGVAVEVQDKNEGKDKVLVQRDYDRQDVATVWLYPDDFDSDGFYFTESDFRKRARSETTFHDIHPEIFRHPRPHPPLRLIESFMQQGEHSETTFTAKLPAEWVSEKLNPTVEDLRSRYDRIPLCMIEQIEWGELFTADQKTSMPSAGDATKIHVKIPVTVSEYPPEPEDTLGCKNCDWTGSHEAYALIDKGGTGKSAVCPECHGQLHLAQH